jgi:hypothetical protein
MHLLRRTLFTKDKDGKLSLIINRDNDKAAKLEEYVRTMEEEFKSAIEISIVDSSLPSFLVSAQVREGGRMRE